MSRFPTKPETTRRWSPHMWLGSNLGGWLRLLARNGWRVQVPYWHIAAADTIGAIVNSTLRGLESLCFDRRVRQVELESQPVFILGHWRSGTTLLHELLASDPSHMAPTTYQCFCPQHFLITEWIATRFLAFVLPPQRPMDNMASGFSRPQEDEFALANMGLPSPYCRIAFPNNVDPYPDYLALEAIPERELEVWRRKWLAFLKRVTHKRPGRRLILKSPPHTARLPVISRIFPEARYVHLVRDPYELFLSTMNLWRRLDTAHGYQTPSFSGLDDYVLNTLVRMYEHFERGRQCVRPDQICEIRYEDLVSDPLAELQRIYEELNLGDFERARQATVAHLQQQSDYVPARHNLTDHQRRQVETHWAAYFEKYRYQRVATTP